MRHCLRFTLAVLALSAPAAGARAQEPELRKVLVPLFVYEPLPGAYGSLWITDFWVGNAGSEIELVYGLVWSCFLPECIGAPAPIEPGVTMHTGVQSSFGTRGAFVHVPADGGDSIRFGLRFRDLSRQATTWGTELPLAREDAFRGSLSLVDVPVTSGFRQTLRIYELEGVEREALVRVRSYRLEPSHSEPFDPPDPLLGEVVLTLTFAPTEFPPENPGFAIVTDFSAIADLGDAERIRIEIEPVTPGLRLWAFVSVAHNETQHATVITPQ